MRRAILLLALLASAAHAAPRIPDPALTTPAYDAAVTPEQVCTDGTSARRLTTSAMKREVYAAYNVQPRQGYCDTPRGCEIDHAMPLACGGVDTVANLWPQPYPEATWKDRLEDTYWRAMCQAVQAGDHEQAAAIMSACHADFLDDWRLGYLRRFGAFPEQNK